MRLGIFGGSFDPPHVGHWLVALDAMEALALDRLVFVPAHVQPLKVGQDTASPEHRLRMVELAVEGEPRCAVDPIEIERGGLSYSVDTLDHFARTQPDAERYFLIGADAATSFASWRDPDRVARLARLVVLQRRVQRTSSAIEGVETIALDTRQIDISSTEIRARIRAGKPIRGFVLDSVARYIATERLYR